MRISATEQREGMGLLEYQSMPSLCDIAYDGVMSKAFFCETKKTKCELRADGISSCCCTVNVHNHLL